MDSPASAGFFHSFDSMIRPILSTMKILLARHGDAESSSTNPERPLSDLGRRQIESIADQLRSRGERVDEVLHSDLLRAKETAEMLAAVVAPSSVPKNQPGLNPNDDPIPLAVEIADRGCASLLVGHLPFMHLLSGFLVSGRLERGGIEFLPGTVACFERSGERWKLAWRMDPEI